MGRFSCLVVVLVSACADSPVGVPDGTDGTNVPPVDVDVNGAEPAPRLAPTVCGAASWAAKVPDTKMDISVARRLNGAAITTTPIGGGTATGFVVDPRGRIEYDGTLAASADKLSVSYAANRLASTVVSNGNIDINLMADDMSSSQLVTSVPGNVVAKPAFVPVGGNLVMPVGGNTGMSIYRFADSYEPIDSRLVIASAPVVSMTAASFGTKTLTAWSTAHECYVAEINGLEAGNVSKVDLPCAGARLAVDPSSLYGVMVYDTPAGAVVQVTQGAKLFAAQTFAGMTAPRVMFDGKRFWVSYLDKRGDILVGFINEKREVLTLGLNFVRPFESSYELAMVDGSPWVFALDADGYTGHRLCAVSY